jgi:outer membrane lipoprotein-sorting protein
MKINCRPAATAALTLPLFLSGCALISTTRKLPVPKAPAIVYTVTPESLVDRLNKRWADLSSLNVTVDMQASVLKTKEGLARDYTTFSGIILMRKPEMLRVYGRLPVIGTRMFDMVSDGKNFKLFVPHYNKVYKGSNASKKKSTNQLENMRPGFFFDAMAVRGMDSDDLYGVVADTETIEDKRRKHLYSVPEYILTISRHKPGSQRLTTMRVVTFSRDNLLPSQQDIYDNEGNLESQVYYSLYQDFGGIMYPSTITIKRPQENYQLVMTVEKVKQNMALTDDQFEIKLPEGTLTQILE